MNKLPLLNDAECYILDRLREVKPPSFTSTTSKKDRKEFHTEISKIVVAPKVPTAPILFTLEELDQKSMTLKMFVNLCSSTSKIPFYLSKKSLEQVEAEKMLRKLNALEKSLQEDMAVIADRCFVEIVEERRVDAKKSIEKIIEDLDRRLKKPDDNDFYLRDVMFFIRKLRELPAKAPSILNECIKEKYFFLAADEKVGNYFVNRCQSLIELLQTLFNKENVGIEQQRIISLYGPKIKEIIPDQQLPQVFPFLSCQMGPLDGLSTDSQGFFSVECVEDSSLAAYSFAAPDPGKSQYNGDSFLVCKMWENGPIFTAIVDATGNSADSARASKDILKRLFNDVQEYLKRDDIRARHLVSRLLWSAHYQALLSDVPCTLAFNFVFPDICFGGVIGNARALVLQLQPELRLKDLNLGTSSRGRSATKTALGEIFRLKQTDQQFNFWYFEMPSVESYFILASNGMSLEANTLHTSPRRNKENPAEELDLLENYEKYNIKASLGQLRASEDATIVAKKLIEHSQKLGEKDDDMTITVVKLTPSTLDD